MRILFFSVFLLAFAPLPAFAQFTCAGRSVTYEAWSACPDASAGTTGVSLADPWEGTPHTVSRSFYRSTPRERLRSSAIAAFIAPGFLLTSGLVAAIGFPFLQSPIGRYGLSDAGTGLAVSSFILAGIGLTTLLIAGIMAVYEDNARARRARLSFVAGPGDIGLGFRVDF